MNTLTMRIILLFTLATLIFSCKKEYSCECFTYTKDHVQKAHNIFPYGKSDKDYYQKECSKGTFTSPDGDYQVCNLVVE